jgi:RNA polymerase sigma factor (sigma-70 family)
VQRYRNPALKQLRDQQIKYAPRDVQLTQISRAERLLDELNPAVAYRYPEICEKITSYRGEMYPDLMVSGAEAVHDLRCFVEDLSDSADISAENAGEEVWTVDDVSRRFNVSSKTVSRWRDRGLVSRRFRFGGRKRVGFLRSSVERFVSKNPEDVDRGSQFSQLTVEEREELIYRARRLAKAGGCPTEISHRLAKKFHRSPETVRYTLKNYDKDHPEAAVFPHALSTITDEQKKDVYRSFRKGVSVEELAKKYDRTRASIYRLVAEMRAEILLEKPIEHMSSPLFDQADAAELILQPAPVTTHKLVAVRIPPGLPSYLSSLYSVPLLTREEEVYYFRKMNFLLHQAAQLQQKIEPSQPKTKEMDSIERMIEQANEIKNFLIRSNLRLVVSIAKKHMKPNCNFFEMVSDGNISLIRAIEKFDFTRGFKFSTYASWAIMKNYARSIPAEYTQLDRFRTGSEDVFQQASDPRSENLNEEAVNQRQHEALIGILSQLDPRERDIIVSRYGLKEGKPPQTLEQVGQKLGVTKERIRQLESRALQKLRKIAEEEHLDVPGI